MFAIMCSKSAQNLKLTWKVVWEVVVLAVTVIVVLGMSVAAVAIDNNGFEKKNLKLFANDYLKYI